MWFYVSSLSQCQACQRLSYQLHRAANPRLDACYLVHVFASLIFPVLHRVKTSALQSHSFTELIKLTPPHRLSSRVYVKHRNRADSNLLQPTNRLSERLSPVSESVLIYHVLVSVWSVLELNQLPVCISDVRLSVRVTVPADTPCESASLIANRLSL